MRHLLALVQLLRTRDFHRRLLSTGLETTDDWPREDVVAVVLAAVRPAWPVPGDAPDVRNNNAACTHGIAVLSRCAVSQGMAGGTSATTAALIVSVARNHTRHWSITAGRAVKRSRPCRLHSARTLLPIPFSLMQAALPRRLHTCAPVTVRTNPRWSPQCKSSRLKFFSEIDIFGRHPRIGCLKMRTATAITL